MFRLLIDDEIFIYQRFGGVSRIFSELLKRLPQEKDVDLVFSSTYSENEYLNNLDLTLLPPFLKGISFPLKGKFTRALLKFINHRRVNQRLLKGKITVFHPSFYEHYYLGALQKSNTKLVFTVHDLIHEKFPVNVSDKLMAAKKAANIAIAHKIIVVSEHTKKDLLAQYPLLEPSKIEVIYLSHSLPTLAEPIADLPETYILFVGERAGYKNFEQLLQVFVEISKDYPNLHLFCAGSRPFSAAEKKVIEANSLESRVKQKALSERQLKFAYENALFFVFPSLYEGFGIPVLEAFACQTPVLISNRSSLPEVAGGAACLFNPNDKNDLSLQMKSLLNDVNLRKKFVALGNTRVKDFSWEKHYAKTLAVYRSLI
jgi:glycosyltransferase involved in cell wall biosynthesis